MFKLINNIDEYKQFILSVRDEFNCEEEWEQFFGFELKWDEETGEILETLEEYKGNIKYKPNSFPSIVYSNFEEVQVCRDGRSVKCNLVDFIELDKLFGNK